MMIADATARASLVRHALLTDRMAPVIRNRPSARPSTILGRLLLERVRPLAAGRINGVGTVQYRLPGQARGWACAIAVWLGVSTIAVVGPASADPDGGGVFRTQCSACHSVSPTDQPRIGPPLSGVVGRKAGSVPGFKYSYGLANAGFVWDAERLDAWLLRPQAVVPTTSMVYRVTDAASRRALIDWLAAQR